MRHLLPLLFCVPTTFAAAPPVPHLKQVQAAMAAQVERELEGKGTASQVAMALFAPRLNALPWCLPAAEGAVDCSVGYERGMDQHHRMMRLSPRGDGWHLESTRLPVPVPDVTELAPQLQGRLAEALAGATDDESRAALRKEADGMRLSSVHDCDLDQASGQLQCTLALVFDRGRTGRMTLGLQRVSNQWRLDPLPID